MNAPEKSPAELLATPLRYVKGVGPRRAEILEKLRLRLARDVLFHFPREYQQINLVRRADEFVEGQPVSFCGVIQEVEHRDLGPGKSLLGVLVRHENEHLRLVWFNQPFQRDRFPRGRRVLASGKVTRHGLTWEMSHPRVEFLDDHAPPPAGEVAPVYNLTEGLSQAQMRQVAQTVARDYADLVEEVLPPEHLRAHALLSIGEALRQIHEPGSLERAAQARRRFIHQELLVMQLALAWRRHKLASGAAAPVLPASPKIDARALRLFPFEPTAGQRAAMADVAADMARGRPMNRLLQGDVGSGKTMVAIYAMLLAVAHGRQAALMAPTEVLARQHFDTLAARLAQSRVRLGLLTGSVAGAARRALLADLAEGRVDLLVGTHALLGEQVAFHKLGLVVIDEQHKFGVRQRAKLRRAGEAPHYLVMTATPIPRSVSMTMFGDLDVSILKESPPGRQPARSYWASEGQRARWWEFYRNKLREGRQGFVIAPLVEQSDDLDAASAVEVHRALAAGELRDFPLGLAHGRQSAEEKAHALEAFRDGETRVLVATSVVEVGVDVPNATLLTIEGGERFGLSQLHQLRGRVCRGAHPGYVCVFADPKSDDARQRLELFTQINDGFELAEADFALRGPGDLFGQRQHGLPPLRVADLQRDAQPLAEARQAARELFEADPELTQPQWARLRKMVLTRYGKKLELVDVG